MILVILCWVYCDTNPLLNQGWEFAFSSKSLVFLWAKERNCNSRLVKSKLLTVALQKRQILSEEQKSKERNSEFPTLPSTPAPITVFLVSSDSDQYFLCCVGPGPYFGSCACGQIFKFGAAKRRGGAWYTWYTPRPISSCTQRPAGSIPGTETMAG